MLRVVVLFALVETCDSNSDNHNCTHTYHTRDVKLGDFQITKGKLGRLQIAYVCPCSWNSTPQGIPSPS